MVTKTTTREYERKKQELLEKIAEIKPFQNDTEEEKKKRIEKANKDHIFFCKTYLPHYFGENETPGCHREWIAEVERTDQKIIPLAAPRGHAKSTLITLAKTLKMVLYKEEKIIPIISDTNEQATERLTEIKMELLENERIKHDFGEFEISGKEDNLTINSELKLRALGSGQKVRGLRMRQHRPGLIICDDLENDEAVMNIDRRKKLWKWFMTVLVPALHPTKGRIFIVGTVLHYDSLLNNLLKKYNGKKYKAICENGNPLWPARFPLKELERMKEDMGSALFNQEMQNEPLDNENATFRIERISTFHTIEEPTRRFRYIDPAVGKNKKTDCHAVVNGEVGLNTKTIYITDIYLRKVPFQRMMEYVFEDYKLKHHEKTAMETIAFQEIGRQWIEERSKQTGIYMPLTAHIPRGSKQSRIESLVPLVENGTIKFFGEIIRDEFKSDVADMKILIEQFLQYPIAKNDDGPDSVAGLIDIIRMSMSVYTVKKREKKWKLF